MGDVTVQITTGLRRRINNALHGAREDANELLSTHDDSFGRTTRKNQSIADFYIKQIKELDFLIKNTSEDNQND